MATKQGLPATVTGDGASVPVSEASLRHSFGRIRTVQDYPDFLEVQLKSFQDFSQSDAPAEEREDLGLQAVFKEHFPIQDSRERYTLEFIHYTIDSPKHSVEECIAQGLTFSVPLKAKLRLSSKEDEDEDEAEEAIEQDVYLGNLPYMTERGTFIVNGAERVIVSQLHRSPGVFFGQSVHPNGTDLYSARIIPFRGSWIEFSTDVGNVMWAYIDRKKKLPVTTLLRALGFSTNEDLVRVFDLADAVDVSNKKVWGAQGLGRKLAAPVTIERKEEVVDEDTGEVIEERMVRDVVLAPDTILTDDHFDKLKELGILKVFVVRQVEDGESVDNASLLTTIKKDPTHSEAEALFYLYEQLRGTEAPDVETARGVLDRLFFSEKRYDLGDVGRYRMNKRLRLSVPQETLTLTIDDITAIIRELINLQNGRSVVDDIDHLGNRRVRTVGEQLGRPVLARPRPHGADDQGAHEPPRRGELHAPGPRQRADRVERDQHVLRHEPAEPVHGPDEPARGADAQASPLRARAGWSDARARGLRGARRSLHALRAPVPDRDAGRAEHRPDLVAVRTRAHQRVRLYRDALPGRQEWQGLRRDPVSDGRGGGRRDHRAGQLAARRQGGL